MPVRCLALILALGCSSSAPPAATPDAEAPERDGAAPARDLGPDLAPAPDAAAADVLVVAADTGGAAEVALDGAPPGWYAVSDYGARGPYSVAVDLNTGPSGMYNVVRPARFQPERRHPIISWANGTLFGFADYRKLLEHWASHGFVVIAAQTNTTAGGGTHKAGIDWLVAENRAGGRYAGGLDVTRIGAAGHSQGGGATIAAGSNKPGTTGLTTTLPLMPILSFESDKTIVSRQLVPMLNINASMDDRDPSGAVANQIFDGARAGGLVQASFAGIHEDAMNAAMQKPTLAWFRLHLMGDEQARALFFPPGTCELCKDAAWKQVRHK